jgi:DNA-binding HxlR family transcriptional regulator
MAQAKHFRDIQAICDLTTDEEAETTRDMMTRIADKWSLWVMGVIAKSDDPVRFSYIWKEIGSISQKSLTKTLRQLERDGLVARKMFVELPPRVEYRLTPLGTELLKQVEPLWRWVSGQATVFRAAQQRFDRRSK